MGDLPAVSAADHSRLAKVPAGGPMACRLLALARNLLDAELADRIRRVEQIEVGVPAVDATAAPRQEVGRTPG